jgi:O-antigen/teichoic acid export membrane protein
LSGADIARRARAHVISALDQGISSVTNVVAVVALARAVDSTAFGVFSLLYASLALFLGASRAFFGIPIALGRSGGDEQQRQLFGSSVTALTVLSPGVVIVTLVLGAVVSPTWDDFAMVVPVMAAATVGVLFQDVGRYQAVASGRAGLALTSDLVWLAGSLVVLVTARGLGPLLALLVWAGFLFLAMFLVLVPLRPRWSPDRIRDLLRLRFGTRESVTLTVLLSNGTSLVVALIVSVGFGVAGAGSLRGASTLFGPINTLIAFLDFSLLGAMAARPRDRDARVSAVIGVVACAITAAWALIVLLIPDDWGRLILGATWPGARSLAPITAIEYVFLAAVASASLVLKVRSNSRAMLSIKLISSAGILLGTVLAVLTGADLRWVSSALAAAAALGLGLTVVAVGRSLRRGSLS